MLANCVAETGQLWRDTGTASTYECPPLRTVILRLSSFASLTAKITSSIERYGTEWAVSVALRGEGLALSVRPEPPHWDRKRACNC